MNQSVDNNGHQRILLVLKHYFSSSSSHNMLLPLACTCGPLFGLGILFIWEMGIDQLILALKAEVISWKYILYCVLDYMNGGDIALAKSELYQSKFSVVENIEFSEAFFFSGHLTIRKSVEWPFVWTLSLEWPLYKILMWITFNGLNRSFFNFKLKILSCITDPFIQRVVVQFSFMY